MRALLPFLMAAALGVSVTFAAGPVPQICATDGGWHADAGRAPAAVAEYLGSLAQAPFDLRAACARWAGSFSRRHQAFASRPAMGRISAPRFILFPAGELTIRQLAVWLAHGPEVRGVERAAAFVVAEFDPRIQPQTLRTRSEERRVGKECRSRRSQQQ